MTVIVPWLPVTTQIGHHDSGRTLVTRDNSDRSS